MTLYVVAFRQGQQAFQSILAAIGGMYEDNLYMSNLFQYLAIPDRAGQRAAAPALAGAAPTRARSSGIRFEDVGFRYPGSERAGRCATSTSSSRSGRASRSSATTAPARPRSSSCSPASTSRPRAASSSTAATSATGTRTTLRRAHRRRLPGLQPVPVQGSARTSALGSVEHLEDEARRRARRRSAAAPTRSSARSPAGLDTQLGRWFKDGAELSGGQWQKVALARAFMREEADILVLDEPTAALDAEAEHAVFERFRSSPRADDAPHLAPLPHRAPGGPILVIEEGQVVEQGTHEELRRAGGRYAHLFALQAQGYQ